MAIKNRDLIRQSLDIASNVNKKEGTHSKQLEPNLKKRLYSGIHFIQGFRLTASHYKSYLNRKST